MIWMPTKTVLYPKKNSDHHPSFPNSPKKFNNKCLIESIRIRIKSFNMMSLQQQLKRKRMPLSSLPSVHLWLNLCEDRSNPTRSLPRKPWPKHLHKQWLQPPPLQQVAFGQGFLGFSTFYKLESFVEVATSESNTIGEYAQSVALASKSGCLLHSTSQHHQL